MTIMRFYFYITALILLTCVGHIPAQADEAPSCTAIATLFEQVLCREALRLDDPAMADSMGKLSPEQKQEFRDKAWQRNLRKVKNMIWHHALLQKFGEESLTPSEKDIATFQEGFRQSMADSYKADIETKKMIEQALQEHSYQPKHDKTMRDLLQAVTMSIKFYEQRTQHTESLPTDYQFISENAERQIAEKMVTNWKADKLLHDAYGGRLAMMKDGPVPVDAYRAFLAYIRDEGALNILDPDFQDALKETDDFVKQPPKILPDTDPIAQYYFNSPHWAFNLSNNKDRLKKLESWIQSLPVAKD